MALCDEQAKSTNTLCAAPRSSYNSRTRAGGTCLSCTPVTISVGVSVLATAAEVQPQDVTCGARRTPVPQVAPTGSETSICSHTESLAAGSTWSEQPD